MDAKEAAARAAESRRLHAEAQSREAAARGAEEERKAQECEPEVMALLRTRIAEAVEAGAHACSASFPETGPQRLAAIRCLPKLTQEGYSCGTRNDSVNHGDTEAPCVCWYMIVTIQWGK